MSINVKDVLFGMNILVIALTIFLVFSCIWMPYFIDNLSVEWRIALPVLPFGITSLVTCLLGLAYRMKWVKL